MHRFSVFGQICAHSTRRNIFSNLHFSFTCKAVPKETKTHASRAGNNSNLRYAKASWSRLTKKGQEQPESFWRPVQKTPFDDALSSMKIDIKDPRYRTRLEHYSNLDELHYTYSLVCTVLSILLFIPVLWILYGSHTLSLQLKSIAFSEYHHPRIKGGAKAISACIDILSENAVVKGATHLAILIVWLGMTDGIRYQIFTHCVGKYWKRWGWTYVQPRSIILERYLWAASFLRGKKSG